MKPERLEGHVALVTGASSGLGRALARGYANAGARVAILARRAPKLEEVAKRIEARGGEVLAAAVDVTDAAAVDGFVRDVEARWGPPTVLVNNAGILGKLGATIEQDPDDWRRVLDVNLTGAFIATRRVLPGMRAAGRGSIISVGSGVGKKARSGWGAYAVSKHALEAFTYNVALEEADTGVRANVVDPGPLRTAMRRQAYPDEDPSTLPAPEDVVGVFLWLATDGARGTTGRRLLARKAFVPDDAAFRAREL